MKVCLHHFLKHCKNCVVDFDPQHKPNNLDCPRFKSIEFKTTSIKEVSNEISTPKQTSPKMPFP